MSLVNELHTTQYDWLDPVNSYNRTSLNQTAQTNSAALPHLHAHRAFHSGLLIAFKHMQQIVKRGALLQQMAHNLHVAARKATIKIKISRRTVKVQQGCKCRT